MKDFKKGLSFGMGIVNAGQRAVSEEPELVVISTPGSFRMTAQVDVYKRQILYYTLESAKDIAGNIAINDDKTSYISELTTTHLV